MISALFSPSIFVEAMECVRNPSLHSLTHSHTHLPLHDLPPSSLPEHPLEPSGPVPPLRHSINNTSRLADGKSRSVLSRSLALISRIDTPCVVVGSDFPKHPDSHPQGHTYTACGGQLNSQPRHFVLYCVCPVQNKHYSSSVGRTSAFSEPQSRFNP